MMKRINRSQRTETLELSDPDGNIVEVQKSTQIIDGEEGFSSLRMADGSGSVTFNQEDGTFSTHDGVILRRQEP